MLNISTWKEFRIGDLFRIEPTKGKNQQLLVEGNDVPYIAASKENNGFNRMVSIKGHEDWVSKGNCLQLIHIGDAAAGHVNYIPVDFIGMSGKSSCAYNDNLNEYNGLFIASIIAHTNNDKYSFKDSWTGPRVSDTVIILPASSSGGPDWDYMESYMKRIMEESEKALENLEKVDGAKRLIDTSAWKKFRVGDLFDIHPTNVYKVTNNELLSDNAHNPVVANSGFNNGIVGFTNFACTEKTGVITFTDTAAKSSDSFFYQTEDFVGYPHVQGMYCKIHDLNEYDGKFITTVLRGAAGKFDFVTKMTRDIVKEFVIKLPTTPAGEPDWAYMESYMKGAMRKSEQIISDLKI